MKHSVVKRGFLLVLFPLCSLNGFSKDPQKELQMEQDGIKLEALTKALKESQIGSFITLERDSNKKQAWQECLGEIEKLVYRKEYESLKPIYLKITELSTLYFTTADVAYQPNALEKNKIHALETFKKSVSSIKTSVIGQKIKAAFSFNKHVKQLRKILVAMAEIITNQYSRLKEVIEIAKK